MTDKFDLVLIDCPPSLGELTRNALYAATDALVVTEPSFFAVNGAEQALEAVSIVATHGNPGLRPIGIVANRVRPTLPEHNYRMDELRSAFGELVLGGLPDRAAIQQAQGACARSTMDKQRRGRHQPCARQTPRCTAPDDEAGRPSNHPNPAILISVNNAARTAEGSRS